MHLHLAALDAFPTLDTARLHLRALRTSDAPRLFTLYRDERTMLYRGVPLHQTPAESEAQIHAWENAFAEKSGIRWGITQKSDDTLIGTAGFHTISHENVRGVLGYELDPLLWNHGLMTEALEAITAWSFSRLNLHTIEANIAPDNYASKRVLEKLGFVQEAHFRENYFYEKWWDSVIYTLHKK